MRRVYVLCLLFGAVSGLRAQCLTDLKKILPQANSTGNFNAAKVVLGGNYLVVASAYDDTLGYQWAGAAYLFEKTAAGWDYRALLKPSNPVDFLRFGDKISIDSLGETVAIASYVPNPLTNYVYVFKKPVSGWSSMSESERFKLPDSTAQTSSLELTGNGLTLVAGQAGWGDGIGSVWIYDRNSQAANFGSQVPGSLSRPTGMNGFGVSLAIDGKRLAVGCGEYHGNYGAIAVFSRNPGPAYSKKAIITSDPIALPFAQTIEMKGNLIVSTGYRTIGNVSSKDLFVFTKKPGQEWRDTTQILTFPLVASPKFLLASLENVGLEVLDDNSVVVSGQYSDDVYTGEIVTTTGFVEIISPGSGADWSSGTRTVILEEPLPPDGFFNSYGNSVDWNGHQLAIAPTLQAPNSTLFNSVTTLTLSNGIWGGLVKVRPPILTASEARFGFAEARANESLFVGSVHDSEAGQDAGAVLIYSKTGQDWTRKGKILPPQHIPYDTYFGCSVAASDSVLAVGAKYYNFTGEVFLYKRTGPSWDSFTPLQVLSAPPGSNLLYMGSAVAISSKVMAASTFNLAGQFPGTGNSLVIYERKPSGWEFQQIVDFNNAFIHDLLIQLTIRNDSIFVYTGYGISFDGKTTVLILTKNNSGTWVSSSYFAIPQEIHQATMSVEVGQDHVFIGAPNTVVANKLSVGAVLVYSKPTGTRWPAGEIQPSAILYPKDTIENGFFGFSVSNTENTLAVGAPGTYYNSPFVSEERKVPGATYILTAKDFGWTDYDQLLKLQGTSYGQPLKDGFGYSVETDYDYYFMGAPYENNEKGAVQAGAVYTIHTPPLVKLLAPICSSSAPKKLFGYPFGGLWSGPGVVSGQDTFNPALVGPGKYLLNYKTPNCAYEGKLLVEVLPTPPTPSLLTPLVMSICPEHPQKIKIQPVNMATYKWYFTSPSHSSTVVIAGQDQPELLVGLSGYYFCEITVSSCSNTSPVVTVNYETPTTSIGPQPVICQKENSVQLQASPSGGVWNGRGVASGGMFSPTGLINGSYPVVYSFVSPSGCQYMLRDTVILAAIPAVTIEQLPGDYCLTGLVTLQTNESQADWSYSWKYQVNPSSQWNVVDNIGQPTRTFVLEGFYKVTISSSLCSGETDPVKVGLDKELPVSSNPEDSLITVCQQDQTILTAVARDGAVFQWSMSPNQTGPFSEIGTASSLAVKESGFYRVQATLGFCISESKIQEVYFYPSDSLRVPNVFTPNGDESNPVFEMIGNITPSSVVIINRWGEEVYRSSRVYWDGGASPGGVYFWMISYKDCFQEERNTKGYVQLVR